MSVTIVDSASDYSYATSRQRDNPKDCCPKQRYVLFNKAFKNFIRDLSSRFPEASEFKMMLLLYKVLKSLNPRSVHRYWYSAIGPYYSDLSTHDMNFLTSMNIPVGFESYSSMLPSFRAYLSLMSPCDLQTFWRHIDVLLSLSALIQSHDSF